MANHFPVLPQMQLSAVQYMIGFTDIAGPVNSIPSGSLSLVNFAFQRGTDASGMIQFDYSLFDQDVYEANLKNLLNALSGNLAANLAVTGDVVQAALTVSRNWFFYSPSPVFDGSYAGHTLADQMPYP